MHYADHRLSSVILQAIARQRLPANRDPCRCPSPFPELYLPALVLGHLWDKPAQKLTQQKKNQQKQGLFFSKGNFWVDAQPPTSCAAAFIVSIKAVTLPSSMSPTTCALLLLPCGRPGLFRPCGELAEKARLTESSDFSS